VGRNWCGVFVERLVKTSFQIPGEKRERENRGKKKEQTEKYKK
jgi:hypothetical protein